MKQMQRMYGGGAMKKRRDGIASKAKQKALSGNAKNL